MGACFGCNYKPRAEEAANVASTLASFEWREQGLLEGAAQAAPSLATFMTAPFGNPKPVARTPAVAEQATQAASVLASLRTSQEPDNSWLCAARSHVSSEDLLGA